MGYRRPLLRASSAIIALLLLGSTASAADRTIAFAGFAYAGDDASIDVRFPVTRQYASYAERGGQNIYGKLVAALDSSPPQSFSIEKGQLDGLKGRDQAIVTALVVTSETISVEKFDDVVKVLALVRAQALFFDFKTQTVIRAYPISLGVIKLASSEPTDAEKLELIRRVFEGNDGKPGLVQKYAGVLATASLPGQVSRTLQVSGVDLGPTVLAALPSPFNDSAVVRDTWMADIVSEAVSSRTGVPILPYAKGYAIGNVMALRFADGEIFNLKLPKPDYEIRVNLKELKKILYGQSVSGASYVYGAYADLSIVEPMMEKTFLALSLKNGEVKEVPVSQTYVDDFPAYYDAINQLFVKLSLSIDGKEKDWIRRATDAKDVEKQLNATRELFKQCN